MLQLETIFRNHFADKNISDDHFKKFTEDHLQRIIANNNNGLFNQILSDTETQYTSYFGNISSEDISSVIRKSFTLNVTNLEKTFKSTVSQKEGIIKGQYGANSSTYQEFFPQGLTEYHDATKANIETLMNRMVSASQNHQADLGANFVQVFTDLRDSYVAARTAQLGKKGEVSTHKIDTKTSRTELELQLTKNIFFIGYNFPGDTTHALSFFDQSIIQRHHHANQNVAASTNPGPTSN